MKNDAEDGTYFVAHVSKEDIVTISDWLGIKWAKLHSTKIIVLIVGNYKAVYDQFNAVHKQPDSSGSEIISKNCGSNGNVFRWKYLRLTILHIEYTIQNSRNSHIANFFH